MDNGEYGPQQRYRCRRDVGHHCAMLIAARCLARDVGTTTMSTQTTMQAFAGLVLLTLYVAIAASFGFVVGAGLGATCAGLAGALDVTSARRLPAWLLAGVAMVFTGWVIQAVAIDRIPTSGPLDADAERAWRLAFACPFLLGLLSLVLAPLLRTPGAPHDEPGAPLPG